MAISDEQRQFALPVSVLANTPELEAEIAKIAVDNEAKEIVLGESRNYDGQPNMIFEAADKFKKNMEAKGFKVLLELEFMTSVQAERHQGKTALSDASAAALILQSYLDREQSAKNN